jgi:hypothetical protein
MTNEVHGSGFKWAEVLAEVRQFPGEWRRADTGLHRSTVVQCAADLRNAHARAANGGSTRWVEPGEVWDAYVTRGDLGDSDCSIWIRLRQPAA